MKLSFEHIKLLLVDDDELDRMAFERSLQKTGLLYTLDTSENALLGLEMARKKEYDCIFIDYLMPGTDGMGLLKQFRENGILTPVAVLTSQGDEKIAVEMMKAGAFDYFPKSEVNPDKIASTLRQIRMLGLVERQRKQAEAALRENERLLEIVFKAATVGISLTNEAGVFVRLNQAFCDILGWEHEALLGQNFTKIFKSDFQQAALQVHKAYLRGEITPPEEWVLKRKDGQKIHLSTSNSLYTDESQNRFVVSVITDITEKKKAEADLFEAKSAAELAAKAKAEFLSNMSHEIRTPMNAVIGLTELLLQDQKPELNKKYLESIKYSADNLLVIINDILDFSKIESGKITFEKIDFSIRNVVDQLLKAFAFKAEEKGLVLRAAINDDVPEVLLGDPFRLNQMLLNLASNAVKFTRMGSIEIGAAVAKQEGDHCEINIWVKDTGIGIRADKLDAIFESFTQAYTDTTRLFGGTGLGLAITRNLARLQHGEVKVTSEYGRGSSFIITLPFQISKTNTLLTHPAILSQSIKDFTGRKFLLVEDNKMNQFVAKQILQKWHAEVVLADHGASAIALLLEQHFDLVFMDLQMPVMGGFEATACIRNGQAGEHNKHIPIVALSADAFQETKLRVVESGMNGFITKPLDQDDFYSKTAAALDAQQ
ncbi:MAG: response regulator [Sphingobacteriaceae bacterium]|nr:response regulator [Sphingobacteriaceae bacterium]